MHDLAQLTSMFLVGFAGMVMLIWVLPSIVHRQGHPLEDRELSQNTPHLKLHP